jgi:hypothetical protein
MKKYIGFAIVALFIPQITFAAWWNPLSWTWFQKIINQEEVVTLTTSNNSVDTEGTSSPKLITCNPRTYSAEYFEKEKPCISDMTATDIAREKQALSILEEDKDLAIKYGHDYRVKNTEDGIVDTEFLINSTSLRVSDERYVLLISGKRAPGTLTFVVDLKEKKVVQVDTEQVFFTDSKRMIKLSQDEMDKKNGEHSLYVYTYGTAGYEKIENSSLGKSLSYASGYSYEAPISELIQPLATSSDSITLGVYDRTKKTSKPEIYFDEYLKTGTKTFNLK